MKLSHNEINKAIILHLSGVSYASIARTFGCSSDTVRYHIKKNQGRLDMFTMLDDGKMALRNPSVKLEIENDLITFDIIETGDPKDGIIYCESAYKYTGNSPLGAKEAAETEAWAFCDGDIGALKTLIVGKVIKRETRYGAEYSGEPGSGFVYTIELKPADVPPALNGIAEKKEAPVPIWNASNRFISITVGRKTYNADSSHSNFKQALNALIESDFDTAIGLINPEQGIIQYTHGNIEVKDYELYYKGLHLKNGLTSRIVDSMYSGVSYDRYANFLEKLMENPSNKAINRLFDFLEANDIEITDEGNFIAWKKIRSNYRDIRTNTFDNSPGTTVSMARNMVDEDDEQTCSHGLHVCSKSYLAYFGGSSDVRIVRVLVDPKNVVSIPLDYGNAKMRTCEYTVLDEVYDY